MHVLAQGRTLPAWWRSGLAALAVAIGIGRIVPALLGVSAIPFVTVGVGFGLLGLSFVLLGASRDRAVTRHLATGRFEALDGRVVWAMTAAILVLGATTVGLLIAGS